MTSLISKPVHLMTQAELNKIDRMRCEFKKVGHTLNYSGTSNKVTVVSSEGLHQAIYNYELNDFLYHLQNKKVTA